MRYSLNTELASFINAEQASDGIQAVFAYPSQQLPKPLLQEFISEVHSNRQTCYFSLQLSQPSGDLEVFLKTDPLATDQHSVQLHNTCATKLVLIAKQLLTKAPAMER